MSKIVKLEKLNIWLTLGANFGVIIGIMFLAIEINQNNVLLEEQARYTLTQNMGKIGTRAMEVPEFTALLVKLRNGEELTPEEEYMRFGFYSELMVNWQWEFEQYQAGRLSLDELPNSLWKSFLNGTSLYPSPGLRNTIENAHNNGVVSNDFYNYLNNL